MSRRPTPFQSPCCAPDLDRTCQGCGRVFCQIHDATVGDDGYCPDCADPLAPLDHWRASVATSNPAQPWENESGPRGADNTTEGLTHSSDYGREGLAMQATRTCSHCGVNLPADVDGRGGKQPNRRYCSTDCKTAARYSGRSPVEVKCEVCGRARALKHPNLAGSMCRPCAAQIGAAIAVAVNSRPPMDRFADLVAVTRSGCWQWIGTRQPNGYGAFGVDGRTLRAHRWSYEHFVAPIPEGLEIDHLCRNRACVNPDHLEAVTHEENMRRSREAV